MRALATKALIATLAVVSFLALNAGQALATHISCGDTITQDTKLDSDLIDCPGDGIVIGADDITLDLNGRTIDGDDAFYQDFGVQDIGHDYVAVRNGVIRDFGSGIFMEGANNNSLRGLVASIYVDGSDNLIEQNLGAIGAIGPRNVVRRNTSGSISISDSESSIVANNYVFQGGILVGETNGGNEVRNNFVFASDPNAERFTVGIGLQSTGRGGDLVKGNFVSGQSVGIYLNDSACGAQIESNAVSDNEVGFSVLDSCNSRIEKNRVTGNDRYGVFLSTNSRNTHVERNWIYDNGGDGVFVEAGSKGSSIRRNTASRNGDDGIDIEDSATTLSENTASRNEDLGIEAVEGVIDGGGNKAFGNGNPLQCLNVVCN